MQNTNTRLERFGMWVAYRLLGGYGSPSLAAMELAPTLRWAWTGRAEDASKDGANWSRYVREIGLVTAHPTEYRMRYVFKR